MKSMYKSVLVGIVTSTITLCSVTAFALNVTAMSGTSGADSCWALYSAPDVRQYCSGGTHTWYLSLPLQSYGTWHFSVEVYGNAGSSEVTCKVYNAYILGGQSWLATSPASYSTTGSSASWQSLSLGSMDVTSGTVFISCTAGEGGMIDSAAMW
jgi:hypothetical protein